MGRFALKIEDTSGLDLRILRLGHWAHDFGAINRLLPSGELSRSFASVPIEQLMQEGYFIKDRQELEYRAPDAQVVLSHKFRLAHCVRTGPPACATCPTSDG